MRKYNLRISNKQKLPKFKKYQALEDINSFYITRDIFINKDLLMKNSAWSEDCVSYKEDSVAYKEDVIVSETTSGGVEIVEQKLNNILETPIDTKVLIEVTRLNRGDASDAIALAVERIKQKVSENDLRDLQETLERQIKAELTDENKRRDILTSKKQVIASIEEKLKTTNFENNELLNCLKSNFTKQIQGEIKQFVNDLISKCDGGPKYVDLKTQIMKIMAILFPKLKNQEAEVNCILTNKNFDNIRKITTLNKFEQDRFINHVNCLKSFNEYISCGDSLSECRNRFTLSIAKELTGLSNTWSLLSYVLEELIKNPLYDFSKCDDLTNQIKESIYCNVYNLKEFSEYLSIINHLNSSKFRQNKDLQKIMHFISEWVRPNQQKQLKEYLKNYDFLKFYSDPNIGQLRMLRVHNFIKGCQDYTKYQRQQQNSPDEIKPKLILALRQFLLKIEVPFEIHTEIEKLVFSKNLYDLLSTGISNKQKKQLFEWIISYMNQFYKSEFNSVNLKEKTRDYLIDMFIKLNLDLPYRVIIEVVENVLKNVDAKYITSSGNFNDTQKKQIRKAFKDNQIVKNYVDNLGIDTTSLRFNTQNTLLCNIMVPEQIGCLNAELTKKVVQEFLKNPENQTIKSSDLPESQKKKLITLTQSKLKSFKNQMKKVVAGSHIKRYQEYFHANFDAEPIHKDSIWRAIQNYGYIKQDEEGNLDMGDEDDLQQIKQVLENEPELRNSLRLIQQSQQFHQFKFQFPELSGKNFKQAEEELLITFKKQLENKRFDEQIIEQFQKAVETAGYKLDVVQQMAKFRKMAAISSNIPSYISYKNKKDSSLNKNEFLKSIEDEQRLFKILQQNPCFDKYLKSQKHEIICLYRKHGIQFLNEVENILTKNDLEALRKQFLLQENQQQQGQKIPKPEKTKLVIKQTSQKKEESPLKVSLAKADIKGKKGLPVAKWKKQEVKKICNKSYEQLIASLDLLKEVGQKLKVYEQKGEIIAEYKAILQQKQKEGVEALKKQVEDPNNESHIKSLASYEAEVNSDFFPLLDDFIWEPKPDQILKTKYKIIGAKIKKLKEEIAGPRKNTVDKITKVNEELKRLSEVSK